MYVAPPTSTITKYSLSVTAEGGGSVSPTSGSYNSGTQISVTATPNAGYQFVGWSNGSTANPVSVTINSNTSLTATFDLIIKSFTLTALAGEGGTISTEGGEYNEGTEVEISATPNENYQFVNWTDSEGIEIGTDNTINISILSNTDILANFSLIPENIIFSNPLISSGILSGEFSIDYEIVHSIVSTSSGSEAAKTIASISLSPLFNFGVNETTLFLDFFFII